MRAPAKLAPSRRRPEKTVSRKLAPSKRGTAKVEPRLCRLSASCAGPSTRAVRRGSRRPQHRSRTSFAVTVEGERQQQLARLRPVGRPPCSEPAHQRESFDSSTSIWPEEVERLDTGDRRRPALRPVVAYRLQQVLGEEQLGERAVREAEARFTFGRAVLANQEVRVAQVLFELRAVDPLVTSRAVGLRVTPGVEPGLELTRRQQPLPTAPELGGQVGGEGELVLGLRDASCRGRGRASRGRSGGRG